MKRNLILSLLACGASVVLCQGLHAQDTSSAPATTGTEGGAHPWGGHHGGGGLSLEKLTTALSLTSDQQAQIKPILDTMHSTMQTLRGDTTLSQQDKMSQMKTAHQTAITGITAVLTPDQQAKFTALLATMHKGRHGGGGAGDASDGAAAATYLGHRNPTGTGAGDASGGAAAATP
jgi:Spy/CpxP family protein refolding chaperone